mmetsp:Transcript_27129/g.61832  ORF Transcript_27129/g.61832 Transcript_27129/m.61832 type:complete len:249 (+) Transcript_27129:2478-3224(+)
MVKQRKESEWTEAAASSATTKKARCCKVGEAVATSTADELELGDTPCYSQKSRQNNDIGVGQHWPKIAAKVGGGGSDSGNLDILSILDIECALPTVSGYLSPKEKMCLAISVSCVDGCEGQPAGWKSRFGVKPSCRRCEEPICGCNDKIKDFEFCPDCGHIFCGRCVVGDEGNFEGVCDFGGCKISGCFDCRWGSDKLAICSLCDSMAFCKDCGTRCEFCPKRYCRVECALECDCEGLQQYYDQLSEY